MTVAGIQEASAKWFGSDVWPVDHGWVFLCSGRPSPSSDAFSQCGEGVLSPAGVEAWNAAGYVLCHLELLLLS